MQPCNFTHWSTRSSRCSCTCDWHPLNGSLLYTLLTPFCCSKTPQKNSPLYSLHCQKYKLHIFAEFDSERLCSAVLFMAWFWRKLSKSYILGRLIPRVSQYCRFMTEGRRLKPKIEWSFSFSFYWLWFQIMHCKSFYQIMFYFHLIYEKEASVDPWVWQSNSESEIAYWLANKKHKSAGAYRISKSTNS